jgi:hypothetical protein
MMMKFFKLIVLSFLLTVLLVLNGCERNMPSETGLLEGRISIGPICPSTTIPPAPECLPTAETYNAYPVTVWTSDGRWKIGQVVPDLDGLYSLELMPGQYLLVLEKTNSMIGGSNLPLKVTVTEGQSSNINIDIDTGIR